MLEEFLNTIHFLCQVTSTFQINKLLKSRNNFNVNDTYFWIYLMQLLIFQFFTDNYKLSSFLTLGMKWAALQKSGFILKPLPSHRFIV